MASAYSNFQQTLPLHPGAIPSRVVQLVERAAKSNMRNAARILNFMNSTPWTFDAYGTDRNRLVLGVDESVYVLIVSTLYNPKTRRNDLLVDVDQDKYAGTSLYQIVMKDYVTIAEIIYIGRSTARPSASAGTTNNAGPIKTPYRGK